jgi:hypothetical protein
MVWLVAVLGFCAALLPFAAAGAVEQWATSAVPEAIGATVLTVILVTVVALGAGALIAAWRQRRRASGGAQLSTASPAARRPSDDAGWCRTWRDGAARG